MLLLLLLALVQLEQQLCEGQLLEVQPNCSQHPKRRILRPHGCFKDHRAQDACRAAAVRVAPWEGFCETANLAPAQSNTAATAVIADCCCCGGDGVNEPITHAPVLLVVRMRPSTPSRSSCSRCWVRRWCRASRACRPRDHTRKANSALQAHQDRTVRCDHAPGVWQGSLLIWADAPPVVGLVHVGLDRQQPDLEAGNAEAQHQGVGVCHRRLRVH